MAGLTQTLKSFDNFGVGLELAEGVRDSRPVVVVCCGADRSQDSVECVAGKHTETDELRLRCSDRHRQLQQLLEPDGETSGLARHGVDRCSHRREIKRCFVHVEHDHVQTLAGAPLRQHETAEVESENGPCRHPRRSPRQRDLPPRRVESRRSCSNGVCAGVFGQCRYRPSARPGWDGAMHSHMPRLCRCVHRDRQGPLAAITERRCVGETRRCLRSFVRRMCCGVWPARQHLLPPMRRGMS